MPTSTLSGKPIPVTMPRQKRSSATPVSEPELSRAKKRRHVSNHTRSSRTARSQTAETESLELPSLNERGLYALPTEGDGMFSVIDSVYTLAARVGELC